MPPLFTRPRMTALVAAAALGTCMNANADYYWKGGVLLQHLQEQSQGVPSFDVALTLGYVSGVVDTLQNVIVCEPAQVSLRDTTDIIRTYLENHPETGSEPANRAIADALSARWPCERK